ncbi:cytosine permease [Streptomyces sp. VRA16 Mangrove soil]|uniref:purine-cytosine permease family protein n=1 Tax=Streptomyces sp. VRA16 Mangrove soil TaxID=2817434 RepID=UPI001A9DAD6B|nr:cytosine permease [Streptomyces sp. VRA16 Mangrove soil]MBO1332768.1 cytosine permease [Streptomyces sp. VRA16 Mangrove soil]
MAGAEEYEHAPVPQSARKSLPSVAAVWFGFPMNLGNAVFGGVIVYDLGLVAGLLAILVGNLVLFGYVGALSHYAGRTGKNFALQAADTFGRRGRIAAAGLLATVVIGWFSFQIGLTGSTLHDTLGWSPVWGAVLGCALYTLLTVAGIRALALVGAIATPLFVILAVVAVGYGTAHASFGDAFSYQGTSSGLGFGGAVAIVIAGFADSGTMTADFTRWSRDGRSAVAATFFAFPLANFLAYAVGGVVVAIGGSADPATDGGGFLSLLTGHGPLLTAVAVVFVFVNLGSVASHCLYNGAVGWSALTPARMRPLALGLGVLGLLFALTGVWGHFVDWLNLLGVFVPPIGAVLITDQYLRRRGRTGEARDVRWSALGAWAAGALVAGLAHYLLPGSVDPLFGIVVAAAVYAAAGRRPSTQPLPEPAVPARTP